MRKNSIKMTRINSEIQKALCEIIRDVKDPRISPLASVTYVDTTTDLKDCKVYVSVYGDEKERKDTEAGLKSAGGFIRRELAHTVNLRNTPQLHFIIDTTIEDAMDMMKKIDEVVGVKESGFRG